MKEKVTLFIRLKYEIIMMVIMFFVFLTFIIIGSVTWGVSSDNCIYFIGFCLFLLIPIIDILYRYQTITFSENGVTIKSPIRKYCELKWEDIRSVSVKLNPTMSNNVGVWWKNNWIFIGTADDVVDEKWQETRNRKGKPPYVMLYRPKHARILLEYLQKYCPLIDLSDLLKTYSTKSAAKWGHWHNQHRDRG